MEIAGRFDNPHPVLKALSLSLLLAFGPVVHGEPTSGVVTAGSATINANGAGNLVINQTSQNASINWQTFNIGAAESVKFAQPNSSSVALNRVLGSDPSRILGSLSANGKVFLVNPNGILFGKNATVNVGGLVASALDIGDTDFMAGRYRFDGSGRGEVSNLGNIHAADGGYVALLGNRVGNEGTISARLGTVALAAGSAMTLAVAADGLLHVTVDQPSLNALASNGGLVQADGGAVIVSAQARDALLGTVVNNTGIVQANSVGYRNGRVVLDGGDSGIVIISGDIRASGVSPSTTGGTIVATGDKLLVADTARLDASGTSAGGSIFAGGGWQGGAPDIRQANGVYIAPGATLDASASRSGNGGTVVAWSNIDNSQSTTRVYGSLLARGGPEGGDGGRIETSGHWIDVAGIRVHAGASKGKAGQWLLDPEDLLVGDPFVGVLATNTPFAAGPPAMFTSGALTPNVLNTDIETQLNAGTSVVLQTGSTGGGSGDITLAANITKTGGADTALTLNAHGSIVFGPGVAIASVSGKLNVNLNAATSIMFFPFSDIATNGGNIAMTTNAVFGIPPLLGIGTETLTLNILGATSIGLGTGAGAMLLPAGFATGFSAINVLAGSGDVTVGGLMGFTDSVSISTSGNIIVDPASAIATSKVGGTLALAGANFINNAGAGAVTTFGGGGARWIIYSNDPSTNAFGGLSSGNPAIWGQSFGSLPPGGVAGDRYVFATPGVVTATTTSPAVKPYGQTISVAGNVTYSGAPLTSAATYGNVYQDVLISDVLSVLPTVSSPGAGAQATVAGSPYPVTASGGIPAAGYGVSYVNSGLLAIDRAVLEVTALADSKTYNGQTYAGGNGVSFGGFLNSDNAAGLGGNLVYGGNSQNAVNVGQYAIVPGGLTSNDYSIRYVDGSLAIRPKELVVTGLVAETKDFDGTIAASIRNWGLVNPGVGSQTLVLNHGAASFSDPAPGSGKTVTAGGYSLANGSNGGLASNYVLKGTVAQTTADIFVAGRGQSVQSVQATMNGMVVPLGTQIRRGTLNLDASPLGLSSNDLDRGNSQSASANNASAGPNANTVLVGNRIVVRATSTSPAAPAPTNLASLGSGSPQQQVQSASLAGSPGGGSPAATRFSSTGFSGLAKPISRTPSGRPAQLPRDAYLKGAARASVVGSTTSGAAVLATLANTGQTARLAVTVAPREGFGISIPRDLMIQAGAKGDLAPAGATSSAGALPAWITFDRAALRLDATNVPPGALPLTVKLPGASGKSVEVTFK
jgi:filamentous hemagglutinin family protein